jgi:Ras-related protein Rab-5C
MEKSELKSKIIIIGDSAVGKSSIAARQCRGEFKEDTSPTIGSAHLQTNIKYGDESITLVIWDTAGQEEFASLVPMYARKATVAIICASFDIPSSIENIDRWVQNLYENGEKIPIIIAINKIDKVKEQQKEIDRITKMLEDKYDTIFFTSAKTGYNINELFVSVASKCFVNTVTETVQIDIKKPKKRCC